MEKVYGKFTGYIKRIGISISVLLMFYSAEKATKHLVLEITVGRKKES